MILERGDNLYFLPGLLKLAEISSEVTFHLQRTGVIYTCISKQHM